MSRKTISFQMPKRSAVEASTPAPRYISTMDETSVDRWVHRQDTYSEAALTDSVELAEVQDVRASPLTITISGAPNVFEIVKIVSLPYLTVWVWSLGVAQRNLRLFAN
jgi:hypothetical protein